MHITQKTNYLTMAHDLFISAWITAIITILLTPSLGKRSDLHNTLRVDRCIWLYNQHGYFSPLPSLGITTALQ